MQGRQYPVEILYLEQPENSYVEAAIMTVLQLHAREPKGHILVFLTGQEEIEAVQSLIQARSLTARRHSHSLKIFPSSVGRVVTLSSGLVLLSEPFGLKLAE